MAKQHFHRLALAVSLLCAGCAAPTAKPATQQTFMDKLGASVKSGTSKVAASMKPKQTFTDTPLDAPTGKPGANVFVAAAQMHERSGNFDEAEANYQKALRSDPRHIDALIGYARLEDRRSNFEAATRLYQRAVKAHPKAGAPHNDMGLCFHRRGMLNDATRELNRAVELEGDSKLYRNNLAAVYVEQGMNKEALAQLTAAHGQSVGNYNLGYLLMQKGNRQGAIHHFQIAVQRDPKLVAAQQWIAKLSAPATPYAAQAAGVAMAPPQGAYQPQRPAYVAQRVPPQQQPAPQYAPPQGQPQSGQYAPPQSQSDPMPPLPNR